MSATNAIDAITPTMPAIAAYVRPGYSHMRTFSRSGASRSRRARMRSCETAIRRYTNSAIAPDELTRNRNTVFGEAYAITTAA